MLKSFNENKLRYKLKKQHWNKEKIDKYIKQLKNNNNKISNLKVLEMICLNCNKSFNIKIIEKFKKCPNCNNDSFNTKIKYTLSF